MNDMNLCAVTSGNSDSVDSVYMKDQLDNNKISISVAQLLGCQKD